MSLINLGFINKIDGHTTIVSYGFNKILYFSGYRKGIPYQTTLHGLNLSKGGILREHSDLKDLSLKEMKEEAIKRFYKHLHSFKTMKEIQDYIIKELKPHGYELINIQVAGQRIRKVN